MSIFVCRSIELKNKSFFNLRKFNRDTYLIAEVLESEGEEFALRDACHAEVEPGTVVFALHVRRGVTCHPNIEVVLLIATLRPGQVSTTKLAAEYNS